MAGCYTPLRYLPPGLPQHPQACVKWVLSTWLLNEFDVKGDIKGGEQRRTSPFGTGVNTLLTLQILWDTRVELSGGLLEMQTWTEVQGGHGKLRARGSKVKMKATYMFKAQRRPGSFSSLRSP